MKLLLFIALGVVATLADDAQLMKEITDGNAKFTANVYKELLESHSGNVIMCPLSVNIVLALVHAGARGITAKQLSDGLQFPENTELVQETISTLTEKLQGNENYDLSSASKVYVTDGVQINDTYKSIAVNVFKSDIENINFLQGERGARTINSWVEKQTHNKIRNLIRNLDGDTRLLLINALYFHGKWMTKFEKSATRKGDFYLNNNDKVKTDMMDQTSTFDYYESPELDAKFLKMPYKGDDISMTIVLPNDKERLGALEDNIEKVLAKPDYAHRRVHVILPKFKIETTIQLNPILQSLGIVDVFEDNADLSGIGAYQGNLKIDKVIQKAFIEVDEEGTTAAAVTLVSSGIVKTLPFIPKTYSFVADHPFLFFLRINDINIFVGRYINP